MVFSIIRKNRFAILIFTVLLVLSYIFIKQKQAENAEMLARFEKARSTVPPEIYKGIKELKEKFMKLELENNLRTQELLTLRRKLKDRFSDNGTEGFSLSLPSVYNSLPHLMDHKDALTPSRRLSKDRKGVTLAFGIPTVRRQQRSYLMATLSSMISGLTAAEEKDALIIVFIGEEDDNYVNEISSSIQKRFTRALDIGLLEVVSPPNHYYPNLDTLPSTFGDPKERVKWRSKQNLDYAFLMMYAQSRAVFYVQMEDDVIATPGYTSTIKSFALQQSTNAWFMLEFSALGFIGKLFHSYDLSILIEFFLIFYKEKPNDWLLDHVFWVKVCNPEKDNKHCNREKQKLRIKFKPSLFQHVGKESSLKGKKQLIIDKDFKKQPLFQAHLNPKAVIKTNFEEYQTFTALRGYLGHTFFWALAPHRNSVLRIIFDQPQKVKRFTFKSGNIEHPGDILTNATVEFLPEETYSRRKVGSSSEPVFVDTDYLLVGKFDKEGLAGGVMKEPLQVVREVLIRVLYDIKDNWVIISEFFIEVGK